MGSQPRGRCSFRNRCDRWRRGHEPASAASRGLPGAEVTLIITQRGRSPAFAGPFWPAVPGHASVASETPRMGRRVVHRSRDGGPGTWVSGLPRVRLRETGGSTRNVFCGGIPRGHRLGGLGRGDSGVHLPGPRQPEGAMSPAVSKAPKPESIDFPSPSGTPETSPGRRLPTKRLQWDCLTA